MAAEAASIAIEVVYALPDEQHVVPLRVAHGTTALQAVRLSGLLARCPEIAGHHLRLGVYGRSVSEDTALQDGDRIEIYRPLIADPKQVRRHRASRQR